MTYKDKKHQYIISSIRSDYRYDELDNEFYTDTVYRAGDIIVIDDIDWFVVEVVR